MEHREQYLLRVRRGSLIEKILDIGDFASRDDMAEYTGLAKSWTRGMELGRYFDNVSVDRDGDSLRTRYVEVRPQVVQSIQSAEFVVEGKAAGADAEFGEMVWPDAPPLIERMENFRKPKFHTMMKAMSEMGKHVSLAGPPGIGKSTSVEQLAAEAGMPLVNISADAGLRRRDLVGTTEMVNGTTKFLCGEYAAAVVNGWWVKIDEINAADPDAILFLNSQMAPPHMINIHGRMYPVHPNFRLFVTYNPGLIGTKPLPPAFKDRFYPVKLEFPTETQLRRLLEAHGMPAPPEQSMEVHWSIYVVTFGERMWEAHIRGQMRYQVSPRRLIDAVDLMNSGLCSDVKDALKMACIATIDSPVESKVAMQILSSL